MPSETRNAKVRSKRNRIEDASDASDDDDSVSIPFSCRSRLLASPLPATAFAAPACASISAGCTATVQFGNKCAAHLAAEDNLVVKPSGIMGAGLGLFTLVPRTKKAKLSDYTGVCYCVRDVKRRCDYAVRLDASTVLCSESPFDAVGRYANTCVPGDRNNARLCIAPSSSVRSHASVSVRATRALKAGDEVFLAYGRQYWR